MMTSYEVVKRAIHFQDPEWLPAYSPELNPQEEIWRHLRRCVTHNHYFGQLDALLAAVDRFHLDLKGAPEQVLRQPQGGQDLLRPDWLWVSRFAASRRAGRE